MSYVHTFIGGAVAQEGHSGPGSDVALVSSWDSH